MKNKILFWAAGIFFLLFLGLTAAVLLVDVQPIGPCGTSVGLAALNGRVFDRLGVNPGWYAVTEVLGVVSLLPIVGYALLGAVQLIRRRSLRRVDAAVLLMGGFCVLLAAVYVFFEIVVVNYRPVLLGAAPEASYPSSHTLLTLCVLGAAWVDLWHRLAQKKALRTVFNALAVVVMAVTVAGRLLSGVHWLTDIAAGVLLSAALVALYAAVSHAENR
ncbi:MAG: phosphatase PAP2 family protein [Clostridia bacterium]|nr:phosphatase PAP2 family protein [Clostridia bacterium]